VSSEQPPLQESDDPVDMGKQASCLAGVEADHLALMTIPFHAPVGFEAVGPNVAPGLDILFDKREQLVCAEGRNVTHPHATQLASLYFDGNDNLGFLLGLAAAPPKAVFHSAYESVVYLDETRELRPIGPNHGSAKLMKPGPSRLVALEAK